MIDREHASFEEPDRTKNPAGYIDLLRERDAKMDVLAATVEPYRTVGQDEYDGVAIEDRNRRIMFRQWEPERLLTVRPDRTEIGDAPVEVRRVLTDIGVPDGTIAVGLILPPSSSERGVAVSFQPLHMLDHQIGLTLSTRQGEGGVNVLGLGSRDFSAPLVVPQTFPAYGLTPHVPVEAERVHHFYGILAGKRESATVAGTVHPDMIGIMTASVNWAKEMIDRRKIRSGN